MSVSFQCLTCVHHGPGPNECEAYPNGIPAAIMSGSHDHRKPYDGDRGIRWEPASAAAQGLMKDLDEDAGEGNDDRDDPEIDPRTY